VLVNGMSVRMEIKEGGSVGERTKQGRNKEYVGNFS
jgi:hypothetical protein